MIKLKHYSQFATTEHYWIDFEDNQNAQVQIIKSGSKNMLDKNETLCTKGITKDEVHEWVYDNWNVYDPRIKNNKESE